jgi:hypothetical protein
MSFAQETGHVSNPYKTTVKTVLYIRTFSFPESRRNDNSCPIELEEILSLKDEQYLIGNLSGKWLNVDF